MSSIGFIGFSIITTMAGHGTLSLIYLLSLAEHMGLKPQRYLITRKVDYVFQLDQK